MAGRKYSNQTPAERRQARAVKNTTAAEAWAVGRAFNRVNEVASKVNQIFLGGDDREGRASRAGRRAAKRNKRNEGVN